MGNDWLFRPLPLRERVGRGVATVHSTLRTRRSVVPSPPHPNPLPRGEREPEVPSAKCVMAQARAQVAAQESIVEKLRNGSRPEEIAQARANVMAAQAEVVNARRRYQRLKSLSAVRLPDQSQVQAVSQEELDDAKAALDEAEAKLTVNQKALELALAGPRQEEIAESEARLALNRKALELALAGPRQEDIAQAEAQLRGNEAQLAFLKQQLADTQLMAPADAVVRTRLLEPGEMSSPQRPVFSLAIIDPKWIRAYVSETDIGKLRPGMTTSVAVDSFPNRHF